MDTGAREPLPTPQELADEPADARHQVLQGLRSELYAIASAIAEGTVQGALEARRSFPPYGLAQSRYTELRMVVASPQPFGAGSITTFDRLGKALVDTMVLHQEREMARLRSSERRELVVRLDRLLALFRLDAGPASRARLRDAFSFLYGGLHFGTSVCVEMVEVMSRVLSASPEVPESERGKVLGGSVRPALRLAGINVDDVVSAYQRLHLPPPGPAPEGDRYPIPEASGSWMVAARFSLETDRHGAWRIDLADGGVLARRPASRVPTYATLGCPARQSPSGGSSAIARLWSWSVELAEVAGLIRPATGDGR